MAYRGEEFTPEEIAMSPERIHDRKSIRSGKLLKPYRHFRSLGLVLMLEKDKSPFPFLRKDPFPPLREIGVGIIGAAQAQVSPRRRRDDLMNRILIGVSDAQAASLFPQQIQNFIIEPGGAAELECAGDLAGNQREKRFQRRNVRLKTLGKLKKDRPQFLPQKLPPF